ncbi:hypothetical protein ACFIOY_20145 [Bradyrhizobium sp. TZ2]
MTTVKLGLTIRPLGRSPSANALMAAVKGLTTMIDEKFAHLRAYRNNIDRYNRLLETELSDLERRFIERRLAEDQSAMERLASSIFPVTPEPPGGQGNLQAELAR